MKNATRDVNIKSTSGDVSDGNEAYVTGTWRESDTYFFKKNGRELDGFMLHYFVESRTCK